MAREQYQQQLKDINNEMIDLADKVENVMQKAVHALLNQVKKEAEYIIESDDEIDDCVRKIDRLCYDILLRQQPVASDLRIVSATLKVLTDIERIGDHAVDISELTLLMNGKKYPEIIEKIKMMSVEMMSMLYRTIGAFATLDFDEANKVMEHDNIVDEIFMDIKNQIAKSICSSQKDAEVELDLLMVAKCFQRVSDHATNIAEWVLFADTGSFPNN